MNVDQIIEKLKNLADPRARAVWKNIGLPPDQYLGVNLTKLKALAKEIRRNHDLALKLWDSGIHDARLLATMIEEPKKVSRNQLKRQVDDLDFWDLVDKFGSLVVAKSKYLNDCAEMWQNHDDEMVKRCAYILIGEQAKKKPDVGTYPDRYFTGVLDIIEETIHDEMNWVKEGMLNAMIAIGSRNADLNEYVIALAERIGEVYIDYGDTACQTPDPLKILQSKQV